MNILVTGGAGYIGSHTCVELLQQGHQVCVLDNFSRSERSVIRRIRRITGATPQVVSLDLCDRAATLRYFQKQPQVDAVIHFAAYKAVGESSEFPLRYYHNNLFSMVNLLDGLLLLHKPVAGLVFSSSCTVYGQPGQLPVTEQSPVLPAESPYGYTKQVCEEMLRSSVNQTGVPVISLRYFNPVGAHASAQLGEFPLGVPNNLMPYLTQTAAGKRAQLTIFGNDYHTPDGTCIRDYIHVCDLAQAHLSALQRLLQGRQESPYEVFNIGTGTGLSVMELVQAFITETGVSLPYVIGPRRAGDVEQIYADTSLAEEKLGWKARLTVKEMVLSAWRWEQQLQKESSRKKERKG